MRTGAEADEYLDPETGLIYLRNRYYDPTTAQFLSRDPLVAVTRSAYGYVDNNPLNGTDPSGLCFAGLVGKHCPKLGRKIVDVAGGVGGLVAGTVGVVALAASVPEALLAVAAVGAVASNVSSALDAYQDCIGSPKSNVKCEESVGFLAGNLVSFGLVGLGTRLPAEIGYLLQLEGHVINAFDSGGELLRNLFGDGASRPACTSVATRAHVA